MSGIGEPQRDERHEDQRGEEPCVAATELVSSDQQSDRAGERQSVKGRYRENARHRDDYRGALSSQEDQRRGGCEGEQAQYETEFRGRVVRGGSRDRLGRRKNCQRRAARFHTDECRGMKPVTRPSRG